MDESILTSIKKPLGIPADYKQFDPDIIMHINTVLSNLTDLGVGPSEGFFITDETATWVDFIPANNYSRLQAIKTYVYLKVRLIFDPPTNSAVIESMNRLISEFEWRINVIVDPGESDEEVTP